MKIKNRLVEIKQHPAIALLMLLGALLIFQTTLIAQPRTEYRAFWVDTFNTNLNNHADVVTTVNNARAAKANALFVQARRRGDSWYLNSLEPMGDRTPIAPGFDPLQDLINEAHAHGIEVHAFVIMSAVWGRAPNLFPPENPNHVFNRHGGYNPATNTITPGPDNWLTRTLIPDGTAAITYQGHRFGSDFWVDFGHPDAAEYTVNVINHLVENYDIDGLHLDRIRYPDITISGQTASAGTNVGYNQTNVERFQRHYNIPVGSAPPAINNPQWNQWRRDQVTNIVRRVYLNTLKRKPHIKVSAALIAYGGISNTNDATWNGAEAYWRVYQDWRAWTQEGIIDIAIPMVYKAEHTPAQVTQYNQWEAWLKTHLYNRAGIMGQGAANNAIEGTLRQTRRTLTPEGGTNLSGIAFYSMATSNIAVTGNPFAIPPGNTPARPFAEFASGLTTGKSVNGATLYEPLGQTPIFAENALIPTFLWKTAPQKGHIMGEAHLDDDTALDTAAVTITNLDTNATRTGATDGGGFYGAVDLEPGQYLVKAVQGANTLYSCAATIAPGLVTTANLQTETTAPVTTATLTSPSPIGQNGWYVDNVAVDLNATDDCTGVALTEYSLDNGATWLPFTGSFVITAEGTTTVLTRSTDRAGNTETPVATVVKIDKTAPTITLSATPTRISPPNGKPVTVKLTGAGADAVSGLQSVSYTVTDEYGTVLSVPTRALNGNSANWLDQLIVEARRRGDDLDGRLYTVTAIITDAAGLTNTTSVSIVVAHDNRP